jgi:hypothetical protein
VAQKTEAKVLRFLAVAFISPILFAAFLMLYTVIPATLASLAKSPSPLNDAKPQGGFLMQI